MNKVFTFSHIEHFVSELSLKNLQIIEKDIAEASTYTSIKKQNPGAAVVAAWENRLETIWKILNSY